MEKQFIQERQEGLNIKDLKIFTDGSKAGSDSGTGVNLEQLNISIYLYTVFQAQCDAITLATQAMACSQVTDESIMILTDSKAALQINKITSSVYRLVSCFPKLCW